MFCILYSLSKSIRIVRWWHGNREVAKGGWKVGQSFSKLHLSFNDPVKTFIDYSPFSKTESFHANFPQEFNQKVEKFIKMQNQGSLGFKIG